MKNTKQTSLPFNKYGNTVIYYNIEADDLISKVSFGALKSLEERASIVRFDSCLEFEVYKILRSKFQKSDIDCHYDIEILPKTATDRALKWRVDFRVYVTGCNPFYVEAKGVETDDYSLRQTLLRRFKLETFNRVLTVKKERLFEFAHHIRTFELWSDNEKMNEY